MGQTLLRKYYTLPCTLSCLPNTLLVNQLLVKPARPGFRRHPCLSSGRPESVSLSACPVSTGPPSALAVRVRQSSKAGSPMVSSALCSQRGVGRSERVRVRLSPLRREAGSLV